MKMDSGKRRITISKNGIEANQNQPPPQPVVASSQVYYCAKTMGLYRFVKIVIC